jgi:hypothetical protein
MNAVGAPAWVGLTSNVTRVVPLSVSAVPENGGAVGAPDARDGVVQAYLVAQLPGEVGG